MHPAEESLIYPADGYDGLNRLRDNTEVWQLACLVKRFKNFRR